MNEHTPEIDCYECVYDCDEEICKHPLAETPEFYGQVLNCYTKKETPRSGCNQIEGQN